MFLSNISDIKWSVRSQSGNYKRTKQLLDKKFPHFFYYSLKSKDQSVNYYLLNKNVEIDQKILSLKIAFQIKDGKIHPVETSPLYAFFPTARETYLNFLIHAPYLTTPARDNIEEDPRNNTLTKELGTLLSESLPVFKQLNMLNVNLLNTLPINKGNCSRSEIYSVLYESVKSALNSKNKLIPTSGGKYSTADNVMLLGSSKLIELLNKEQNELLFDRENWIDKGITTDKTKELRDYLFDELELPEHDLNSFARKLDSEFLSRQSDDWLIHFYTIIHSVASGLWEDPKSKYKNPGILRSKPIIRIDTDKQVVPFEEDGKPTVYLPTETTKYPTVKKSISNDKKAREFLKGFGLTTPDKFDEINEFILSSFNENESKTSAEYYDNIKKIVTALDSSEQSEKRSRLIEDLRSCPFIKAYNNESDKTAFKKPNEVYFRTEELKTYFGESSVFFASEQGFPFSTELKSKLTTILEEVGVRNYPRRREIHCQLSFEEKKELRSGWYNSEITHENYCIDYELNGLTAFLKQNLDYEKSVVLWNLLLKYISGKSRYSVRSFFKGSYSWKYYQDYEVEFDSYFLKQLQNTPWLILKDGNSYLPSDLSLFDLSYEYKTNTEEAENLADILGFKPNDIQAIEEKYRGRYYSEEEVSKLKKELIKLEELRKWKAQQEKKGEEKDEIKEPDFNPDVQPDEISSVSKEYEYNEEIKLNDSSTNTREVNNSGKTSPSETNEEEQNNENPNTKRNKDIGDWGERFVEQNLTKELDRKDEIEIENLNISGSTGVGCDIMVKRKDQIIRLIEVKSTTDGIGKTLSISGRQWETARSHFNIADGNKYWIYCVFNARKKNAEIIKIQNPIEKWKDGKLEVHPVNFIVKHRVV